MTSQEVSEFVNQPIPRKVPYKIFRKVADYSFGLRSGIYAYYSMCAFLFFMITLLFLTEQQRIMDYILLNFGIGNRMTAQGVVTSIWPSSRFWGIGPTSYSFSIRFSTPEGYGRAVNYVWRRGNIPGWGAIPETQNNPRLREALSLTNPFPITVEYVRGRPSAARALGARFSSGIGDLVLATATSYLMIYILFPNIRIGKRLLKKGAFTTGYISKKKSSSSPFTEFKQTFGCSCDFGHMANFTDRDGVEREAFIMVVALSDATNRSWLSMFDYYKQPVGLLYLPGTNVVIITDMLLDHYPKIDGPPNKEPDSEDDKKQKNMTKKENDYVIENLWR